MNAALESLVAEARRNGAIFECSGGGLKVCGPRRVLEWLRPYQEQIRELLLRVDETPVDETQKPTLEGFCRERLEALCSLDEGRIRAWLVRYGMHWGMGERFWLCVHRARATWDRMPLTEEEREVSRRWLDQYVQRHGELVWTEPKKKTRGK